MIVRISGKIAESTPLQVVIDVNGIGYEVNVPLSTTACLGGMGSFVSLYTLSIYREDSQALYGFLEREERDFFRLLVEKVSGVGPKIALGILSRMPLESLKGAIVRGDVDLLSKCPGIGKKTAERLTLELKDKIEMKGMKGESIGIIRTMVNQVEADAMAALIALGVSVKEADKSIARAIKTFGTDVVTTEALIKRALN